MFKLKHENSIRLNIFPLQLPLLKVRCLPFCIIKSSAYKNLKLIFRHFTSIERVLKKTLRENVKIIHFINNIDSLIHIFLYSWLST